MGKTKSSTNKPQTSAETERYTSAMDKIRDEMAKGKGRYVQVVGEYLTDYLHRHPEAESAILQKGKTIAGSLEAMKAAARKEAVDGCGVIDDETGFRIVLEYFGIKKEPDVLSTPANVLKETPNVLKETPEMHKAVPIAPDPFDLDALLGGL